LSEIVTRPDLARPVEGARDAIAGLTQRYRTVAIVTGRRSEEVAALLDLPHVMYVGLYGFEEETPELLTAVVPLVETASARVPDAWIEDKGSSIAVHYRQAPDIDAARAALMIALQPVATGSLEVIEGKMVIELVPRGRPMKGGALERIVGEHELQAVLYAGDDHADLDAFEALDRLAASGMQVVRVAVRGRETPRSLVDAADVVVEGPAGLVELLRTL
jgi:trehalose 6-phosphate phosphatase